MKEQYRAFGVGPRGKIKAFTGRLQGIRKVTLDQGVESRLVGPAQNRGAKRAWGGTGGFQGSVFKGSALKGVAAKPQATRLKQRPCQVFFRYSMMWGMVAILLINQKKSQAD